MKKLENNIFAKIFLSITSLVLTLSITEFSLKTIGHLYNMKFQTEYIPSSESPDYIRDEMYESYSSKKSKNEIILSIGDSFTNAGNVESKYSYPHQLFNLFLENKNPSTVLNMGLCEDSTFGVNKRLKDFLVQAKENKKIPTKVIILIGAADNFERFQKESITEKKDWYQISSSKWYKDLSLYKVLRHIKYHYIQKELIGEVEGERSVSSSEYIPTRKLYLNLKASINNDTLKLSTFKDQLPKGFKNYCNSLHIKFDTKYDLLHSLVIYMSKILASQLKHDLAFDWLLDLAEFDPQKFWGGQFDDAYFRIVQTYQFQSEYKNKDILKKLNLMIERDSSLSSIRHFNEFYSLVQDREEVMKQTNHNREIAWAEIIQLSKDYQFKLYMMNYPSNYISANSVIKDIAQKNNISFIDLNSFFDNLIKEETREKYLEDDDHLTPLGYKLMAQKVFQAIYE